MTSTKQDPCLLSFYYQMPLVLTGACDYVIVHEFHMQIYTNNLDLNGL